MTAFIRQKDGGSSGLSDAEIGLGWSGIADAEHIRDEGVRNSSVTSVGA